MKIKFILPLLFFVSCSLNQANSAINSGPKFSLKSSDISANATIQLDQVFNGFGCEGKNISPQISWQNAPKETKSFALTVYDPDAPTGSGWWHYLAVNIAANTAELPRGFAVENKFETKNGIKQIRNDYGIYNFGGPCPPKGNKPHRYIFTVHALKVEKLDLAADSTAALAGFMINANSLAKASFTAYYGR